MIRRAATRALIAFAAGAGSVLAIGVGLAVAESRALDKVRHGKRRPRKPWLGGLV